MTEPSCRIGNKERLPKGKRRRQTNRGLSPKNRRWRQTIAAPVTASQSLSVLSLDHDRMRFPSGEWTAPLIVP
jgi:hypothetical protein